MSYRSKYQPPRLSPYFEVCLGALIGLGLGGAIPLITASHFLFQSVYFIIDCIVICIGFIICIDGIRRLP